MRAHSTILPLTQSLATRIVITMVVVTLSLATLVTGVLIYLGYQQQQHDALQQFNNIEKSYLPSLAAALWEADPPRIHTMLDGMAQLDYVGKVSVSDELGQTLSRQLAPFTKILASKSYQVNYLVDDEKYPVGQLVVQLEADTLDRQLWMRGLDIGLITLSTLLVSAVLMLLIFRHTFSRHLARMAQYAVDIQRANLDQALVLERGAKRKPDELDLVVMAINTMRINLLEDIQAREAVEAELQNHRRNLEAMVAARTRELEAQNAELNAYAHTVAHDLKHPLTALLAQSKLLQYGGLSAEQNAKLLGQLAISATKMNNIINALLLLASVRNSESLQLQTLDVQQIAQQVCDDMHEFAMHHNAQVQIHGNWPKALGFSPWVNQVFVNYISNAIKYGGEAPRIQLGTELGTGLHGAQVKYWVKDSGAGIEPERQHQLFTEFNRLGTTKADGHGLGLSIVQRIVERLGGQVGYELPPEGGSCFWFSLPAADVHSWTVK